MTASARSLPALIWGFVDVPANIAAVSPATVAIVAGEPPLNGTCRRSMPARCFSISIDRWCWLPLPPDAYGSGGVVRRAYSMNSWKLFTGSDGLTARTN